MSNIRGIIRRIITREAFIDQTLDWREYKLYLGEVSSIFTADTIDCNEDKRKRNISKLEHILLHT